MGGFGSGGRRPGSGRKRKSKAERALDGNAGHRGRVLPHPSAPATKPSKPKPLPELDEAEAPNELSLEARQVYLKLAPHAIAAATLTPATSLGFCLLCENIVLERRFRSSVQEAGSASHRGLIQRIDAELLRFCLAPIGKALVEENPPAVDPMKSKYFGGA